MKDLFEVSVDPVDGCVSIHLNAAIGSSYAASVARKLLETRMVGYQKKGPRNRAFEALAHQIGQGSLVCEGIAENGEQVGPERAAKTYPALEGKVHFDDFEGEYEAVPQEDAKSEVESEV